MKILKLIFHRLVLNRRQSKDKTVRRIDDFARKTREILSRQFLIECIGYSNYERKSGTMERVVMETVMCMFHMDN